MTFDTGHAELDALSLDLLRSLVDKSREDTASTRARHPIREAASYDFASYRMLLEPALVTLADPSLSLGASGEPVDLDVWVDFDWFVSQFAESIAVSVRQAILEDRLEVHMLVWDRTYDVVVFDDRHYLEHVGDYLHPFIVDAAAVFRHTMGLVLFDLFREARFKSRFVASARRAVQRWIRAQLVAMADSSDSITAEQFDTLCTPEFWLAGTPTVVSWIGDFEREPELDPSETFGTKLPSHYSFTPFLRDTVNFGFRMVYRQSWTPLGTQAGEVVRTLPLGPRQSEKVSIKVVRTSRLSQATETSRSVETSTEASTTTKDSREIVDESSTQFHWDVEAEASGPIPETPITASVKAGMGGEMASSSRETKSRLNESMKKSASRLKSETKVVVNVGREITDERTTASEIVNPNDEIAVTYIYSRLQRQYEIQASLAAVESVAYVAERVPAPKELTASWIKRHDWILARVLLNESLRADLETVRSASELVRGVVDPNIQRLMETVSGDGSGDTPGIPDVSGVSGTIPDLYANLQQAYEREVERKRARSAEVARYNEALGRVRAHLYDNILHYCKAIWAAEDPQARYMRYRDIRVPIRWEFIATDPPGSYAIGGEFVPTIEDENVDTARLVDLIDLSGPVGYSGNYAAYRLRESTDYPMLTSMIDRARLAFLRIFVSVSHESSSRSADFECFGAASASREGEKRYKLIYEPNAEGDAFRVQAEVAANVFADHGVLRYIPGAALEFDALRVWISPLAQQEEDAGPFRAGDVFIVAARVQPILEDPERRSIKYNQGPLHDADKAAFFSAERVAEFGDAFADCAEALEARGGADDWAKLEPEVQAVLVDRYYDYLLRLRHTRRILIDSNDVILTREVDTASSLESFKSLHRFVDALTAYESMTEKHLENQRLRARLDEKLLGDPHIDKVTVVTSDDEVGVFTAVDSGAVTVDDGGPRP